MRSYGCSGAVVVVVVDRIILAAVVAVGIWKVLF